MIDNWPGEKLLIKILNTLGRGVGGYLRPRQILRVESARTEARRNDLLVLEQAKRDVEDIRAGRKAFVDGELKLLPPQIKSTSKENSWIEANPNYDEKVIFQNHRRISDATELERTVNLEKIGIYAQEEAEHMSDEDVSDEPVDPDWFARWRNNTQDVSKDEMQRLWARVLAGEVRQPGSYSLHTLDFLSRMSRSDAKLIAKIANYRINKAIFNQCDEIYKRDGIGTEELVYLNDIGILNSIAKVGGIFNKLPTHEEEGGRIATIENNHTALLLYTEDKTQLHVKLPVIPISTIGMELIKLTKPNVSIDYLSEIFLYVRKQGFNVAKIGHITSKIDTGFIVENIVDIDLPNKKP